MLPHFLFYFFFLQKIENHLEKIPKVAEILRGKISFILLLLAKQNCLCSVQAIPMLFPSVRMLPMFHTWIRVWLVLWMLFRTIPAIHGFMISASSHQHHHPPPHHTTTSTNTLPMQMQMKSTRSTRRKIFGTAAATIVAASSSFMINLMHSNNSNAAEIAASTNIHDDGSTTTIAYKTIQLSIAEFKSDTNKGGIKIPVSVWYPLHQQQHQHSEGSKGKEETAIPGYNYKISLRRIGQLLARWDFIPEFIAKEFILTPAAASSRIVDGTDIPILSNNEEAEDTSTNHISYLSETVNDAMLNFLSPLLPVTKLLGIPVLDFDKYATSRDSIPTGTILKPLITTFLNNGNTKQKQ